MLARWMFIFFTKFVFCFWYFLFLIPSVVCASLNFTRCKLDLRDLRWYKTCLFCFSNVLWIEIFEFKNVFPLFQWLVLHSNGCSYICYDLEFMQNYKHIQKGFRDQVEFNDLNNMTFFFYLFNLNLFFFWCHECFEKNS